MGLFRFLGKLALFSYIFDLFSGNNSRSHYRYDNCYRYYDRDNEFDDGIDEFEDRLDRLESSFHDRDYYDEYDDFEDYCHDDYHDGCRGEGWRDG